MDDAEDSTSTADGRVEGLTGAGGRRRWSAADKARIVAESLAPGASASMVARRWRIGPRQVHAWRHEARAGLLVLPPEPAAAGPIEPALVPIMAEPVPSAAAASSQPAAPVSAIEVEIAGAVVRVLPGLDGGWLTAVLRAVRASAAGA
jgi:transposase